MAHCNSIVLCHTAIQDAESKMWSLINLIDNINTSSLAANLPFTLYMSWTFDDSELGKKFEMQLIYHLESGDVFESSVIPGGEVDNVRINIRAVSLPSPMEVGNHRLSARLREVGKSDWINTPANWPVKISLVVDTTATPTDASAST